MKTKDRLVAALTKAGASSTMIHAASQGRYDDYESTSPTPIGDLMRDCRKEHLDEIALLAISGEFDGTKEESQAWFEREWKDLLGGVMN